MDRSGAAARPYPPVPLERAGVLPPAGGVIPCDAAEAVRRRLPRRPGHRGPNGLGGLRSKVKGVNYRSRKRGFSMADDSRYAAFVFAPDASYGLISTLKSQGLPKGVRYVASVTGPWKIFAVLNFDVLQDFPAITDVLFREADGSVDPATALVLGMGQVRKTVYLNETALVRVDLEDVGEGDLERILAEIKETISPEVDRVL